jgi:hypothetical protein
LRPRYTGHEPLAEPEYDIEVASEALEHQAKAVLEAIAAQETAEPADMSDTSTALSEAMELRAEVFVDEIDQQLELEQAGIRRVAATFPEQGERLHRRSWPHLHRRPCSGSAHRAR